MSGFLIDTNVLSEYPRSAMDTGKSACATHDLFMSAISTASGFLCITVKWARTVLSGRCALAPIPGATAGSGPPAVEPQRGDLT